MNDEPKGRIFHSKQNLEIVNIEMDVAYSQGTKYLDRVQAVNHSLAEGDPLQGKPLRMTIFNDELKTFVRGKKTNIVVDIEERPRPATEYGPDRTIVQVYDDKGEPVSRKKGGGGGQFRRSLEDDLAVEFVKRRSIEGQQAVTQILKVLTCPTPIPGEDLGIDKEAFNRILGKCWKVIEQGLDNYLAGPDKRPAVKPPAVKPPAVHQKPQEGQGTGGKEAAVSSDKPNPPEPIKNAGDLLTRAANLKPPVSRGELVSALSINDPKEIKDLEAAWETAQGISVSKAKKQPAAAAPAGNPGETIDEAWDKIKR